MPEARVRLNQEAFIKVLRIRNRKVMIESLAELAEAGNIQAADLYGNFLVQSVWDEERMSLDLARDRLMPGIAEAKYDPYLILGRNVLEALSFYNLACSDSNFKECPAFKKAKAKIEYCHREGLAGYNANSLIPKPELDFDTRSLLKKYAKNALKDSSGQFISLPDKRPEIKNPLKEMFCHFGLVQRDRIIIQISISVFVIAFFRIILTDFRIYFSYILFFIAPLIGCAFAFHEFGFREKMAMCSCSIMKQAYAEQTEKLPEDFRSEPDPFMIPNIFIRNFAFLKRLWLWSIIFSFPVYIIKVKVQSKVEDIPSPNFLINYFLAVILSSIFISWDMKFPNYVSNLGNAGFFISAFLGLVFFFFTDNDCCSELERVNNISDFQMFIDKQIEEASCLDSNNKSSDTCEL